MSNLEKLKSDLVKELNERITISKIIIESEGVFGVYYNNGLKDKYIPFRESSFFNQYDFNFKALVDAMNITITDLEKLKNDLVKELSEDFTISKVDIEYSVTEKRDVLAIYYNDGFNDRYLPFNVNDFFDDYDGNLKNTVQVMNFFRYKEE